MLVLLLPQLVLITHQFVHSINDFRNNNHSYELRVSCIWSYLLYMWRLGFYFESNKMSIVIVKIRKEIYNFVLYKIIEKQNSYMNFSEMYSFWNYIYLKFTLLRFSNIFQFWWISFCSLVIPVILIFILMSH